MSSLCPAGTDVQEYGLSEWSLRADRTRARVAEEGTSPVALMGARALRKDCLATSALPD